MRQRATALLLTTCLVVTACGSGADETADESSIDMAPVDGASEGAVLDDQDMSDDMEDEAADDEMAGEDMSDADGTSSAAADAAPLVDGSEQDEAGGDDELLFRAVPQPGAVAPFVVTAEDPASTFAMDVDTASFTQTLGWLEAGQLPPARVVRPEEFVNWPRYDYPEPDGVWGLTADGLLAAPWATDRSLLRIGLTTASIAPEDRPDTTLTFVVDTSGSMSGQPLATVKATLSLLVDQLRPTDRVGLVEYGSTARVLLEPTQLSEADAVRDAIDELTTGGSTNVEEGLDLGYALARDNRTPGGLDVVVLASDGVANVGSTTADGILRTVGEGTDVGIQLLSLGVADQADVNDRLLEQLADRGNGAAFYIRDGRDAQRLFVDQLEETLVVAALQSKVQVTFDADHVDAYRLIGYENRALADRDFRDDSVDAGEVGAGHEVTAVYELELARDIVRGDLLATVGLRWEDPDSGRVQELVADVPARVLDEDTPGGSLATAVATTAFAEVLRGSPHVGWGLDELADWLPDGVDATVAAAINASTSSSPAPRG